MTGFLRSSQTSNLGPVELTAVQAIVRKQPLPITRIQALFLQYAYMLAQGFGLPTLTEDQLCELASLFPDPSNIDRFLNELRADGRLPTSDEHGRVAIQKPQLVPTSGYVPPKLPATWVSKFVLHWGMGVRDITPMHLTHFPGDPELTNTKKAQHTPSRFQRTRTNHSGSRVPASSNRLPMSH